MLFSLAWRHKLPRFTTCSDTSVLLIHLTLPCSTHRHFTCNRNFCFYSIYNQEDTLYRTACYINNSPLFPTPGCFGGFFPLKSLSHRYCYFTPLWERQSKFTNSHQHSSLPGIPSSFTPVYNWGIDTPAPKQSDHTAEGTHHALKTAARTS